MYNDKPDTKAPSGAQNNDTTDSKKAESDLAISEQKFRMYVELSPVAFFVADSNGKYEYVNQAASNMLGYSKKELLNMNITQLLFKEDIQFGLLKFGELKQKGQALSDITLKTKDGLPVHVILNSVKLPDGKVIAFCENVTERKKAEAALTLSEAKLRSILENSSDQIFMIDRDDRYLFVNNVLANILGKRPEDVIGKSLLEVYPKETANQFSTNTQKVFTTGKNMFVEESMVVNDQDLCISSSLNPVLNAEGNVIAVTGIVRDVTERRKEERELQESQERFRVIFEGANDGILVADIKTQKFVLANPQMCNMLGYPLEDLLKMSVPDIHPKEALPAISEQFRRMAQGEKLTSQGIPLLRSDKQILECEVSPGILDIWDQQCLVGFFRDVTERKKTEAALSISEAKLRSIVENSSDQIFMIDRTQKYLFVNKVLANILGKRPEDIIGKSTFEVYPKETADQFSSNTQNVFNTGKSSIVEETMVIDNQELRVSSSLNPITDGKGTVIAVTGIVRDVTESKKMETAIRDSEEKYRAIVEQSALGILIAQGPVPHIVFANATIATIYGLQCSRNAFILTSRDFRSRLSR